PPQTLSKPPLPWITSLPPPPTITSACSVPWMWLPWALPTIVATSPRQVGRVAALAGIPIDARAAASVPSTRLVARILLRRLLGVRERLRRSAIEEPASVLGADQRPGARKPADRGADARPLSAHQVGEHLVGERQRHHDPVAGLEPAALGQAPQGEEHATLRAGPAVQGSLGGEVLDSPQRALQ